MAQLSYSATPAAAFAGMLADLCSPDLLPCYNNNASAAIGFGLWVQRYTTTQDGLLVPIRTLDSAGDEILGVTAHNHASDLDTAGIAAKDTCDVVRRGKVWVVVEENVSAGDEVWARHTTGSGTTIGASRKSADTATCVRVKGARFASTASTNGYALVEIFDLVSGHESSVAVDYDHAQVTDTDLTVKLFTTPTDRYFVITGASYTNPTGLAQDATNVFVIKVLNGSTVAASWDTTTGAQGTLTADTPVRLVNAAIASRTVPPSTVVSVFFDHSGTQTLPAGRIQIEGYYL
jgi:hypothetical protein